MLSYNAHNSPNKNSLNCPILPLEYALSYDEYALSTNLHTTERMNTMRKRMLCIGLCLLSLFLSGASTSAAQREQSSSQASTTKFYSAADRARPLLNAEFVFQPSVFYEIKPERSQDQNGEGKKLFPPADFVVSVHVTSKKLKRFFTLLR
jgi:hypothetical protein